MDAWTQFHAWRAANESLQAAAADGHGDDVATFATWARRYQRRLDALSRHRSGPAARRAGEAAPRIAPSSPPIVLHGLTMTPQQRRLVAALPAGRRDRRARVDDQRRGISAADRMSDTRARDRACADVRRGTLWRRIPPCASRSSSPICTSERNGVIALAAEILCPERLLLPLQPDASAAMPAFRWASRCRRYRSSLARWTSLPSRAGTSTRQPPPRCCARRSCSMPERSGCDALAERDWREAPVSAMSAGPRASSLLLAESIRRSTSGSASPRFPRG
mgnify:CR=1 FL=1